MVKEWLSTGVNYGLMLENSDETIGYNQFFSSDISGYDSNGNDLEAARPVITIDYINNSGLENYWTYHSQDVGRSGTGYVNDFNGNLVFVHNDLAMTGSKMPLTINHVFNSNDRAITSGYGYGWRLNLSQKIDVVTIGDTQYYVYTDEDGTKHYFYYDNSSGTYKQQMGVDLTFNKNSDGSYTITDKNGGVLQFVSGGYLYKIKDKNDNNITLSYDGNILRSITDGAGRVTTLDVISNGYLIGIVDPSGQRTSFAYNGAQLSRITYPDGNYTVFTYDTNNNLINAKNYDGYNISYGYSTQIPYRVSTVKEIGTDGSQGGTLSIQYAYNTTTFTDNKGRANIYQFTDYGTTVSIKNSDESAEIYKYEGSNKNLYNKLNSTSRMQKFNRNFLKNHGAEMDTSDWTLGSWEVRPVNGSITTEEAYMGQRSLKITKNSNSSRDFYQQQATTLTKGQHYVFSAYVKTSDITKTNNKGAALFITYKDTSGVYNTFESTYVQGTNDWVRRELKFTLPNNADTGTVTAAVGIIQEIGTAYFDCIQLEEGDLASRYNLVQNADFYYPITDSTVWQKNSQTDINDKAATDDTNNTAFKIIGAVGKQKSIFQELTTSGKAGDTFIVSAWGKAKSVSLTPIDDLSIPMEKAKRFAIDVGLYKSDGNADWFTVSFNQNITDWQYISNIIVAKNNYVKIIIYGEYYNNLNEAYFTNFQLYKEEYGVSYGYDDKGNVTSITSLANQNSDFKYDGNNDLTSATLPKGGKFQYEYDSKRNIKTATSATNIPYSFTYDSSGNPLTSQAGLSSGDNPIFMQSTASYSSTGNYLKALIDGQDNSVVSHYNEQKGLLTATTDGNGTKTFYSYDDMNRLISASKILGSTAYRNIEKFPLSTSLIGNKGTRTIFDAGINLLQNSSFENSSNSWTLEDWNGSTGKWRIVSDGVNGNYCLESYDSDGSTSGSATNPVAYELVTLPAALAAQKSYTLSAYAKKTGAENPILGIQCFDSNGAQIAGSYQNYEKAIALNQWIRISNTFNLPAGTKSFFVILRSAVSGTNTVDFDAVQMEENNVVTTYSLSRSDNSKPYYDLGLDKKAGTMSVWFNTTGTGTRTIFSSESSTALFNLYINANNNICLALMNGAGTFLNIITANDITIAANTWYFVALKWQWSIDTLSYSSSLNCTLYVNNKTYTGTISDFRDFTGVITALGSNSYGNYSLSGSLDNFAYSRNSLSDADIQLLYNKTMPDDQGTAVINSYSYENDKIKTITHNGFSYKFEYDNLENNSKVYVENQNLITNAFEVSTGNLLNSVYGNQKRVSMEYDNLDRVTARKFNKNLSDPNSTEETRYTYEYDNNNNLAYQVDNINNKRYRYVYDLSDRLVRVNEVDNANPNNINYTKFSFDKNNNQYRVIQKINDKLYETKYEHDLDNKPTDIFYGEAVEDNENVEYFSFNRTTTGSKGTVPVDQNPILGK